MQEVVMPPPPSEFYLHLESMRREAAQRNAEHEELRRLKREIEKKKLEQELACLSTKASTTATIHTHPVRHPLDFYAQQITTWFNRLPIEARSAPRTMDEFVSLLQGRTPGMNAHPGDVSRILKKIGWVRRRNWKSDGEGVRMWWPPI
jgi:hypothetical protein